MSTPFIQPLLRKIFPGLLIQGVILFHNCHSLVNFTGYTMYLLLYILTMMIIMLVSIGVEHKIVQFPEDSKNWKRAFNTIAVLMIVVNIIMNIYSYYFFHPANGCADLDYWFRFFLITIIIIVIEILVKIMEKLALNKA